MRSWPRKGAAFRANVATIDGFGKRIASWHYLCAIPTRLESNARQTFVEPLRSVTLLLLVPT